MSWFSALGYATSYMAAAIVLVLSIRWILIGWVDLIDRRPVLGAAITVGTFIGIITCLLHWKLP